LRESISLTIAITVAPTAAILEIKIKCKSQKILAAIKIRTIFVSSLVAYQKKPTNIATKPTVCPIGFSKNVERTPLRSGINVSDILLY
jgi:hypothetical protein